MQIDQAFRIIIPVSVLLFFLLQYGKLLSFRKRYKKTPFVFKKKDTQYLFEQYKLAITIIITMVVALYTFFPNLYWISNPVSYLESPTIKLIGLSLLVVSTILTLTAQITMREHWKVGVDHDNDHPALITTGIYRYLRNPISLGVKLSLLSLTLMLPNTVMIAMLCTGYVVAQSRIRIEEAYLSKTLGKEYDDYRVLTSRWF